MSGREKYGLDAEIEAKLNAKYDKDVEDKAKQWVAQVTGCRLGQDFFKDLKDGVVLCKLANTIMPGSVGRYTERPKHYLEEKANIDAYLTACRTIGVPSQDMCTQLDLSESRKDMNQVVNNLYALARQAQAVGYQGPSLGVNYYKSREEQIELERKKMVEREKERHRQEEYDKMLLGNRLAAEEKKRERNANQVKSKKGRLESRIAAREQRGRSALIAAPGAYKFSVEEDRSPSPVKFGMDAEHEIKRQDAYNHVLEEQIMDWIEDVTGFAIDSFYSNLKSGQVLCDLINAIRPGTIPRVHRVSKPLMERENIQFFLNAVTGLGVKPGETFGVNDLYDRKDMQAVVNCLHALAKVLEFSPWYKGPTLQSAGKRMPEAPGSIIDSLLFPQRPPSGAKKIVFFIFCLFLSFMAGFGDSSGSHVLWHDTLYQNCSFPNSTNTSEVSPNLEDGTFCPSTPRVGIPVGVGLFLFGVAGLLLDFLGPKATGGIGALFKSVACFLFAYLPHNYINEAISWSLLSSGGWLILVSLLTFANVFESILPALLSLVLMYCAGASALPYLVTAVSEHVPEVTKTYLFLGFGVLFAVLLLVSAFVIPKQKWHRQSQYQIINDDMDPFDKGDGVSWFSLPVIWLFIFTSFALLKWSLQWEEIAIILSDSASYKDAFWVSLMPTFVSLGLFLLVPLLLLFKDHSKVSHFLSLAVILFSGVSSIVLLEQPYTIIVDVVCLSVAYPLGLTTIFFFLLTLSWSSTGVLLAVSLFFTGAIYTPGLYFALSFISNDLVFVIHVILLVLSSLTIIMPIVWLIRGKLSSTQHVEAGSREECGFGLGQRNGRRFL
eukprot:TRINITY_DN1567_c0_g1_i1.p1 TRINITY_DN1567_c0_g1~~TRINITY_DN1567_c0_g1_i1.p1  ORF type:complete len:832 (+),score=178.90 TRINITY_DN1567_c0_g1_i1:46-2541(+)